MLARKMTTRTPPDKFIYMYIYTDSGGEKRDAKEDEGES